MTDNNKKISFSFSKVKKTSLINKVNVEPKEKKELVDCFDATKGTFSYKGNVSNSQSTKQELVIPLINTKTSTDIIKARIEERNRNIKKSEKKDSDTEDNKKTEDVKNDSKSTDPSKNLEELAAIEILKDVNNSTNEEKSSNKLVIKADSASEEISEADIDYDSVPVTDFGLAMLRGMGWKPNSGIGKEPKIVEAVEPKLRPKGLGLGAKPNPEKSEDTQTKKKTK